MADSAPSIEYVLTAWLAVLGKVGTRRKSGDPLPQWIVRRVTGVDVPELAQDTAVVSLHTFAESDEAAIAESDKAHKRMLELALNPLVVITTTTGQKVTIDYCKPIMGPIDAEDPDENLVHYVGRYEVGLPYITD